MYYWGHFSVSFLKEIVFSFLINAYQNSSIFVIFEEKIFIEFKNTCKERNLCHIKKKKKQKKHYVKAVDKVLFGA